MRAPRRVVCSIGSIDPTGAAGITADLRVYDALRVRGVAVITAVTAQNSRRVLSVQTMPPRLIRQQLASIWEQVPPHAVCIGLVPDSGAMRTIRRFLSELGVRPPVVIDPVLRSSSGYVFADERTLRELRGLLPLATLVTPNAQEAGVLASRRIATIGQAESAARSLAQRGCAVLVTGGHLRLAASIDVFAQRGQVRRFSGRRIKRAMRGAGGILAAAITANLARGVGLEQAIAKARLFVRDAFARAAPLGRGKPQL